MANLIIAGGRKFNDYPLLKKETLKYIEKLKEKDIHIDTIISGCADGADKLGEWFARNCNYELRSFPAFWEDLTQEPCVVKYNKNGAYNALAGHIRNKEMAKVGDALIVFWNGKSKGSKHMIDEAMKKGLEIRVIKYEGGSEPIWSLYLS